MHLRIDVPAELGICVRHVGGELLDDEHGPKNSVKADYWFPEYGVVGELKCLSENYFDDLSFNNWLGQLCRDWMRRGLIETKVGRVKINLANLPPICADEVTSYLRKKLDGSLKQASSQIQSSRRELGVESAPGLLFLVNDGNYALPPGMIRNIVARSLPHKHSGINSVIHFSANIRSSLPGVDKNLLYWTDWNVKQVRPAVASELIGALQKAWVNHHSALAGLPIQIISGSVSDIYSLKLES